MNTEESKAGDDCYCEGEKDLGFVSHALNPEQSDRSMDPCEIKKDDSNNAMVADFSSKDLSAVPSQFTNQDQIYHLLLDYNDLSTLPENLPWILPNIHTLSANGNQIEILPTEFWHFRNIEEIHLNENCLENLPDSLCLLKSLKVLKLTSNNLKSLPEKLGELSSLEVLNVDENSLTRIPLTFGLLSNLKVFEANNNMISSLPDNMGKLKSLNILNLSCNKLEALPESVGDLSALQYVDVSSNFITYLPNYCKSTKTLKRFYADENRLAELPEWLSDISSLLELSVKDNKLSKKLLSDRFGTKCKHLNLLDIGGNFLTELPESIGNMTKLEYLYAGSVIDELERRNFQNGNWLSYLPKSFCSLLALREMRMDENQLHELPHDFGNLVSLEYLDLGQNLIHELPESFGNLKNLKVLLLSKNHLQILPTRFGYLESLEDLRMDNNQIAELPESFEKLTNLKTLDLFNNMLMEIPKCLPQFTKLIRLDVEENSFGIPRKDIPLIIRTLHYPPRDPNLKDNWRGRSRDDKDSKMEDIIHMSGSDTDEADDEGESEPYSDTQMCLAARRSMSIWRSHDGPTQREKFVRPVINGFYEYNQRHYNDCDDEDVVTGADVGDNDKVGTYSPASAEALVSDENWEDEIENITGQFDSVNIGEQTTVTWTLVSEEVEPCFLAYDIHASSYPRNFELDLPVEENQFDDIDSDSNS